MLVRRTGARLAEGTAEITGALASALGRRDRSKRIFFFDWSMRRMLPRGLFTTGVPEVEDRMVRRDLWTKYGRPMHFLNLEFEDPGVEVEFGKDLTRRSKRWVEYAVLCRGVVELLGFIGILPSAHIKYGRWYKGISVGVYLLQYLQIVLDREFVQRQLQQVTFFWAMVQAVGVVVFIWVIAPTAWDAECSGEAEPVEEVVAGRVSTTFLVTSFALSSLIIYRMRFLYFLYMNCLVNAAYLLRMLYDALEYGTHSACRPRLIDLKYVLIVCIGLVLVSYMMEVLTRKDFVQASMVWQESQRSENLLLNIIPAVIIDQLKTEGGKHAIAQSFEGVTVLFADVVSFTTMSARTSPPVLVDLLNSMFLKFDDLAENNGAEKIKTIGDCYMAAAGLPIANAKHAKTMARFGLQMLELVGSGEFMNPATEQPIRVRAGIHSGPAVAGVIGHKKFAYDIWGDAVNTASRMESHGEPMRLHCSAETYALLRDDFDCEAREKMHVKGKGEMQTYFVVSEKAHARRKSFLNMPLSRMSFSSEADESEPDDAAPPPAGDPSRQDLTSKSIFKNLSRKVSSLGFEESLAGHSQRGSSARASSARSNRITQASAAPTTSTVSPAFSAVELRSL